jgi:RNA polymerase sigma-70 factor (sigma-E family)
MEFEEYVAARGPALVRFAYLLTADAHAAEDLAQTALAEAYRRWRRIEGEHPDAYVRRVLLHRYLKGRRRRWTGEIPAGSVPDRAAAGPDPAETLAHRDELRSALARLAPRARAVLVLRYYGDLDDQTIADLLQVGPSTVRSTAARALAALRPHVAHPVRNGDSG